MIFMHNLIEELTIDSFNANKTKDSIEGVTNVQCFNFKLKATIVAVLVSNPS